METLISINIPVYNEQDLVIKAIESIPNREDIEIVVVDDCSTDNTYNNLLEYNKSHPERKLKIFKNDENMGVGFTVNKCQDNSTGKWLVELDSDDYVFTERFSNFIDNELDTNYDLVYFDLETNYEDPIKKYQYKNINPGKLCVGSVKFIRRDWLGSLRASPRRFHHDFELHNLMWNKNPKAKFTGIVLVHYNFPKIGSLSYKYLHKEIDTYGNEL